MKDMEPAMDFTCGIIDTKLVVLRT
jgi:hypothetical protein